MDYRRGSGNLRLFKLLEECKKHKIKYDSCNRHQLVVYTSDHEKLYNMFYFLRDDLHQTNFVFTLSHAFTFIIITEKKEEVVNLNE